MRLKKILSLTLAILSGLTGRLDADMEKIRVGHFPNVTHAPVLVARAKQHFEEKFKETTPIKWSVFNAGPEAIEALFAGAIDILYVGPNPAVNGFIRSKGDALRVIAGVASGGAAFVVRQGTNIERFEDIRGRRVSTPQKGNTQDVSLIYRMKEKGLKPRSQGGDVEIFNIAGGDQITAFAKEQIDAAWTVEPWVSRLVSEANGKILFEEGELWPDAKYATTLLVVRRRFAERHPDWVERWVEGHVEIIHWVNDHTTEAKRIFNEELKRETGKPLPPDYLEHSFERITYTSDPMESQVLESARHASIVGYLGRNDADLSGLYELRFLDSVKAQEDEN
ncbi:MAG: ABC transporter substrate-binding protein [Candidatus Omnitrophica bacterium]|nr:ABC transporter substrate-binding protein [Candidatus Omnitrophota bacterium]